jgi:hypothetical protein
MSGTFGSDLEQTERDRKRVMKIKSVRVGFPSFEFAMNMA